MDPDANLKEQRTLAVQLLTEDVPREVQDAAATRLAELVLALDEWIVNGGFLPVRWRLFSAGQDS